MRFRHLLLLGFLLFCVLAAWLTLPMPPLLDVLLFVLIIAIPVAFFSGVVRPHEVAFRDATTQAAKRRRQRNRGAALFVAATLAIAITQPILGATSPDAVILGYGLGVVALLASYLMLIPVALEWVGALAEQK